MADRNQHRVRDATVEELSFRPGQNLAVWYVDDSMWHERLVLWPDMRPGEVSSWWILTPDLDVYSERYDLNPAEGPSRVRIKGTTFKYWSRFSEPTYRFRDALEDDEVKSYMKQVIEDIKNDGSWDDSKIPEKIFNRAGKEETSTAYLGRVLIPRRIAGKGAGVLTLPAAEPLESPLAYSEEVSAAMGPLSPAPEGFIWISEENGYGKRIGEELEVSAGEGVMLNHEVALVKLRRGWIKGRKMKIEDVPAYVEQVRRRYQEYLDEGRLQEDLGLAAKPEAKPKEDDAASPEDARVLAIDWDAQGERYKEFKVAVQESEEYQWKDWPLEGPLCCLFLLKQMFRTAGSPKAWLATWARFKQVQEGDRIMFELRTLVDAIELAATYDQVNAPALASFETISRRIMAIVDAFSAGSSSAPDWGAAKIITGYKGPEDVVSPTLRQWVARRGKDEVELHQARTKMRDARKSLVDEAMAVPKCSSHALKTALQRSSSGRFRNSKTPWP